MKNIAFWKLEMHNNILYLQFQKTLDEEEKDLRRTYITDDIGDDYKFWKAGKTVFLSAPTGSGKTHFILYVLFPYAFSQKKKVLYIVNRRVLKEQLEKEISRKVIPKIMNGQITYENPVSYIKVETYQRIENMVKRNGFMQCSKLEDYDYVICDECHYFYSDSLFNANTELSYLFVMNNCASKVKIFISATIERIEKKIQTDIKNRRPQTMDEIYKLTNFFGEYNCLPDYSYIDLHIFEEPSEIPGIVDNKQRWLIFVNDKEFGEELCKTFENENISANFVDANYNENEVSQDEVKSVVQTQKQKTKILIATSVIDNGINLHDTELKNIIILADTKETFIQMLGRKRVDGDRVNLYICKRLKKYFASRINTTINPLTDFVNRYSDCSFLNVERNGLNQYQYSQLRSVILDNGREHNRASSVCFDYFGIYYISDLAMQQCYHLQQYYDDLLQRFENKGENAFLYIQAEWIGYDGIDDVIEEYYQTTEDGLRENLQKVLMKNVDLPMNAEQNILFKSELAKFIPELVKNSEGFTSKISSLKKGERTISVASFNEFMHNLNMPFEMVKENKKFKIIYINMQADNN